MNIRITDDDLNKAIEFAKSGKSYYDDDDDDYDVEVALERLKRKKAAEYGIPVYHLNTHEFERSWRSIIWDKLKRGWEWLKDKCRIM